MINHTTHNTNDQPWVIDEFSSLVGLRQYPVHYCSTVVFKYHKNNVNRSWMQLSQTFYSGVHTGDGLACFSANLCIQLWSAYCYVSCWKTKINHIRCEHILLVLQGYKAWNTSGTCCCTISTRPEFDFSSAGIRSYTVYFGRVHFQVNFTWRIKGQVRWFLNNLSFSMWQTRWSTFCLNFSRCNTFNSFVLYQGQSIWK